MGAKTALLVYADGDVAQALREAVELDRAATSELVARLLPGLDLTAVEDGNLDRHINSARTPSRRCAGSSSRACRWRGCPSRSGCPSPGSGWACRG
ncbi:DUF6928 family protein [Dactylosporangium aurantiacum]|uniref:DUF6928 family protein n=1 Tax=Dactylosporangium aurantiacum TaxID=35754 RepID=UPI0036A3733E